MIQMNAIAASGAALELEVDRLLNPANFYAHPKDVLSDQSLSIIEKRAILSSWASDACAVDSDPAFRKPPETPDRIAFDTIMDALKELDEIDERPPRRSLWKRYGKQRRHYTEGAAS